MCVGTHVQEFLIFEASTGALTHEASHSHTCTCTGTYMTYIQVHTMATCTCMYVFLRLSHFQALLLDS